MKVFISWSGELSQKVALIFRDWLPSVIQVIAPYVSSEDIDKGARWSSDIAKELEASLFGILCVTPDNVDAAWLNFEAGALSKTIDKSRVCPFLFGLKRSDVHGPLLQFQSTIYDHDDIAKLLHSLNAAEDPHCLDESRLDEFLEVWWPKLKEKLEPLLPEMHTATQAETKVKSDSSREGSEILEELLDLARSQQKLLTSPEILLPREYLHSALARLARFDDINPNALRDLERSLSKLRELAAMLNSDLTTKESATIKELVAELVAELDRPISYLSHRLGWRVPPSAMRS